MSYSTAKISTCFLVCSVKFFSLHQQQSVSYILSVQLLKSGYYFCTTIVYILCFISYYFVSSVNPCMSIYPAGFYYCTAICLNSALQMLFCFSGTCLRRDLIWNDYTVFLAGRRPCRIWIFVLCNLASIQYWFGINAVFSRPVCLQDTNFLFGDQLCLFALHNGDVYVIQ